MQPINSMKHVYLEGEVLAMFIRLNLPFFDLFKKNIYIFYTSFVSTMYPFAGAFAKWGRNCCEETVEGFRARIARIHERSNRDVEAPT